MSTNIYSFLLTHLHFFFNVTKQNLQKKYDFCSFQTFYTCFNTKWPLKKIFFFQKYETSTKIYFLLKTVKVLTPNSYKKFFSLKLYVLI